MCKLKDASNSDAPGDDAWEQLVARRGDMHAVRVIAPTVADEREHFYTCSHCGQSVDRRDLMAVLHHEQDEHRPLPLDD